jgi:hypothetical protein
MTANSNTTESSPTTTYLAGSNMPGYMPENPACEFDTFEEACEYVIGEILNDDENAEEEAVRYLVAIGASLDRGELGISSDDREYWVYRA